MTPSTIAWNAFGKLTDIDMLEKYMAEREFRHGDYCHYTRVEIINSILKNREFWMRCVSGFNDKLDAKQFNGEERQYYSLCFSTGVNENLALWYLYAGMNGQGARIRFGKNSIHNLLDNAVYTLCEATHGAESKAGNYKKVMDLQPGKNVEMVFRDVIYSLTDSKSGYMSLKYNTMTNYKILADDFKEYEKRHKGFVKGLIWYYEKETRLLAKLLGDAADYVSKSKDKDFIIKLGFDETVYKKIKVDFAPEIENVCDIIRIKENHAIQEFLVATSRANLSKYAGTVKMNLCAKCENTSKKQSHDG